jgi:hypothetical protein
MEIARMSALFPAGMDAQPLQMQKRIQEMFAPLLQVMQQRDTEAQRLQSAGDMKRDLEMKEAADVASAAGAQD